jgi:iron complex transport system substrate-binding protein
MLITLSAINVAADSYDGAASAEVDREKILEWNPDVIFCDCSGVKLVMEDEATNPEYYQQLQAYNNGTMYQHPSNTSYYSNVEIPVANLYYMGSILYPEQFADIDVVEKINEVMKFFVGVDDYYTLLDDAGQGYGPLDFGK